MDDCLLVVHAVERTSFVTKLCLMELTIAHADCKRRVLRCRKRTTRITGLRIAAKRFCNTPFIPPSNAGVLIDHTRNIVPAGSAPCR